MVAIVVAVVAVWFVIGDDDGDGETPGDIPQGAVRIATAEYHNGGDPAVTVDSPDDHLPAAARITLWGMTGTTEIADDGTLTVLFTLDRLNGPNDEWNPVDQGDEHQVEGLTEGDTVRAGAVSFEVVNIWDTSDDENAAADVEVTFDENRLGEPLPSPDDISVQ